MFVQSFVTALATQGGTLLIRIPSYLFIKLNFVISCVIIFAFLLILVIFKVLIILETLNASFFKSTRFDLSRLSFAKTEATKEQLVSKIMDL